MAINVNTAGIGDYTHNLMTFSQELEGIGQQAMNIVNGLSEHFETTQGSGAHAQAQQLIHDGIQEGKDVIQRHGSAVDTAASEFVGFDHSAAGNFHAI